MSKSGGVVWVVSGFMLLLAPTVHAELGPTDVFILANSQLPASLELADYYCQQRGVPKDQLIALPMPSTEEISRAEFNAAIRDPLRAQLQSRRQQVKVLLSLHGVPLRVAGVQPRPEDERRSNVLKQEREQLGPRLKAARETLAQKEQAAKTNPALATEVESARRQLHQLQIQDRSLEQQILQLSQDQSHAAVDSELALLWWGDYPTARWLPNTLHWQFSPARRAQAPPVVMTCRLDGPSPAVIRRLITDARAVESKGDLEGRIYVNCKANGYDAAADPAGTSFGAYDESLRELYRLATNQGGLQGRFEAGPKLFPAASCPEAALYFGWYSLANYIPSNRFVPGAIAVHIASLEAVSLRAGTNYWCPNLLADGAAATLGPVAEPYLFAFPRPAEFFGFILTGKYTLVECYFRTLPVNSWQMVLIGDPLYNPYRQRPRLKLEQVEPSPKGSKFPFG
jgi:uncharacterized protein (TIGR03790 family)